MDDEQALSGANAKFERRFRFVEKGLARQGLKPGERARERMEALWEASKREEPEVDPEVDKNA